MAYKNKDESSGYRALQDALKAGEPGRLYVFHGEEDYLKSNSLARLKKVVCQGFEEFNFTQLEGERLKADDLVDALQTLPMGSQQKLVLVRDYKLMQPTGELKELLPELLAQLPEYVCLVFYFEALTFKADKRLNIYKALEKHGQIVEFQRASSADLVTWLKRHFQSRGKSIDSRDCEHMLFLCGYSMTNLVTEVDKIASGTPDTVITREDIDALASRVLEADVFALTDAVLGGHYQKGLQLLGDLLDMREEPVSILAAIIKQLQRLYGARLALDSRKGERYTMELLGYRSSYPAQLMLKAAAGMELSFLRQAQQWGLACDLQLKSNMADDRRTLELLLLRLAQGRKGVGVA